MSNVCLVIDDNTIQLYLNNKEILLEIQKQFPDINYEDVGTIKQLLGSLISLIPGNNLFSAYNRHKLPTPEELLLYLKYRELQIEKNKEDLELKRLNFEVFGQDEIIPEKTELLTPIERRRRVLLISNLFSLYVRGRVTDVKKDPKKFNKTTEEAKIYSNIDAINDLGSTNIFNFIYNAIQTKANSVQNPEIKRKYEILLDKDVFSDLIEDVLPILEITEGVSSTIDEDSEKEESFKENWMVNFRESSSFSSMSKKVRRFINTILKYNYKGEIVKDDLGFLEFLDPEYVHAFFIDKLRIMTSAELLFPLLEKLSDSEPWINTVITELKKQENELLKSSFYLDFRKDFNNYSVQVITRRKNGSYSVESKLLNKPIGVYYLLENWRNNYQTGNILSDISIYNKDGSWNFEHAKELFNQTLEYFNSTSGYLTLEILEELNNKEDSEKPKFNKLLGFMNAAGISINKNILQSVLESKKPKRNEETGEYSGIDYVRLLLSDLLYIFKEVSNATPTTIVEEEHGITGVGTLNIYKDLINTFSTKYSSIAKELAVVDLSAIEDNIRVGGKNIYTHTTPNYLGKLVKILNNSIELSEDEYKNTIEQEFGYDLWFKKTLKDPNGNDIEQWNNSIIADLLDPDIRKHFQHKTVLTRDNKEYSEWDNLDTSLLLLTEFENGIDSKEHNFTTCNIAIPVLADAQSAEFLQVRRYEFNKLYPYKGEYLSGKDVLIDKLYELALQEWDRIQRVRARKQDPSIKEIANYDKRGLTFCFIEELNDYIPLFDQLVLNKDITTFELTLKKAVKDIYDLKFKNFLKKQKDTGILDKTSDGSQYLYLDKTKYNTEKKAEQFLEEYFYNFSYSQSLIIQLVATDLAFYKDMDDFYKRIKEIHSPSLKLDTEATYNGVKVGRKFQNVLHVQDSVIVSEILSTLNTVLKEKVKQGVLSLVDKDYIYNKFTQVNVADAQCLRSLHSYRDILIMGGRWDEPGVEDAYNNLLNGSWGILDFMTIWQTLKPFNYTLRVYYNGEGNAKIKGGLQHKNSEFPLIALYAAITSPLAKSPQLQAFHKILNDPNLKIDCILFESTTKVGKQGVLNIHNKGKFATGTININSIEYSFNNYDELETIVNNHYFKGLITKEQRESLLKPYQLNSADDIYNSIINAIKEDEDRGQVLLKVSFEDYGIQVENPEHIIDHIQLVGTQARKLIASDMDMSDTDTIDVDGRKMTKQQWLDLYNAINTENIIDSFKEVDKIFSNPKEVERILQEEIASSPRYGKDLKEVCTLDENGRFRIPLFDPILSTRVLQLLNSVIRNRITALKIRGGTCVQVSDFGLTDLLNIKFKTEDSLIIDFDYYKKTHKSKNVSELELKKEYNKWAKELIDKGNLSVAYFECYMPAYSKLFYQPLMSYDKNGNPYLDINKLPEDLKKCVGYRIPTENKYSMAPLYIKEFLPQLNGSCIMLPADITIIAGSDFDIDKMYLMLPEFTVSKYNMETAKKDYIKYNKAVNTLMDFIESASDLEESDENFQEWFSKNKDRYLLNPEDWKIRKIKYDYSKKPQEQSKQARNNALIDTYFGVLTNKNTIHKLLNPGGYENIRKAAYTVTLLKSENKKQILEYIKTLKNPEGNLKYDVINANNTVTNDILFINLILNKLTPEDIIYIYKRFKPKTDPLSPQTWVDIHQRNMMGASLVPIYANSNANHAVIQHTNLHVNLNKAVKINGKEKTSLHEIIDKENKLYISRNTSEYLAAAVDNAKDAILGLLNLNLATADSSSYLSRLGFTHMEVGLLIAQPAILEAVEYYNRHKREGITFLNAIDTKIEEYYTKATNKKGARDFKITTEWLAQNLIDSANPERSSIEYDRNLFIVLVLFSNILEGSLALSQVVSSMRSDTKNGAAGPDIATTMTKILKIVNTVNELDTAENEERFNTSVLHGGKGIITVPEFSSNMSEEQYDKLREYLLSTDLPYMNAFTTLGVFSVVNFFDKYFPQTSLLFNSIVNYIETQSIKGKLDVKTMNSIFNDIFTFYLLSTSNNFFNPERIISYQYNGKLQERTAQDYFVNVFPIIFQKFKDEYGPKLNLDFINRIVYVKPHEGTPITTLQFKTVGKIDERLKLEYKQLWGYMVNHSDPEVRKMARDLFLYNFFNSGYAFSGVSFMHLVPTVLKENLYGGTSSYIEDLYNIFEITDDSVFEESLIGNKYKEFAELFIYNRLYSNTFSKFLDVYVLAKDKHVVFFKEGLNKINDIVEINLNLKSSNAEINKIVKDKHYDYELQKEVDVPIRFFRIKIDILDYYYELQNYDKETGRAVYRRVTPLGFKNRVVEYSYNKDALDCTSVLFCNNSEYVAKTKRKNNYEDYESSAVPEMPSDLEEHYNNAGDPHDYAVGNGNTKGNDYMPLLTSTSQVQEKQAAQSLFRGVLGEDLDLNKKDTNMNLNNYPLNEDYKDANGKPICK